MKSKSAGIGTGVATGDFKNIMVIMLAGIGDSLLVTPVTSSLRKNFPLAKISALVMYRTVKEMLDRNKDIDEVIYYDFMREGYWRSLFFVFGLRKRGYDLSLLAYPANRMEHNLISFLIGASTRLSHVYDVHEIRSLSFLNTKRVAIDFNSHTVDENLKLLGLLGIGEENFVRKLTFPILDTERKFGAKFLRDNGIVYGDLVIGMHPGSSELAGMANKRWPKERFAELADKMVEEGAKILIFGGPNEYELKDEICGLMKNGSKGNVILVNGPNIFECAAIIERCDAFVSNDTSLMHIAAHLDVPLVVIVGPNNKNKTSPLTKRARVIATNLDCQPCYRIGENMYCKYRQGRYDCLKFIQVEEVYNAVKEMIKLK